MKLHLGCGQNYLNGYVNLDFPPSEHTVATKFVADKYVDITKISYGKSSIDEIRLHHVFEHFTRPVSIAMVSAWSLWLKLGGTLRIEVPDFENTSKAILNRFSDYNLKCRSVRHIFGSHEAPWAIHCEGYTGVIMKILLKNYGFDVYKIDRTSWQGIYNIDVYARRTEKVLSKNVLIDITEKYLRNFLIDNTVSEVKTLKVWMSEYKKVFNVLTKKT